MRKSHAELMYTKDGITMSGPDWCRTQEGIDKGWYPELLRMRKVKSQWPDWKTLSVPRRSCAVANSNYNKWIANNRSQRTTKTVEHITPKDYDYEADMLHFKQRMYRFKEAWRTLLI